MNTGNNMEFFFDPKSIAIVGASPKPGKASHVILENLKKIGYNGTIYPINPKYRHIGDLQCYRSLADIGDQIDVAVFVLPASKVIDILKGPVNNVRGAIIISSGFKEAEKGKWLEEELRDIVEKKGIRVIGPNCLGIYDAISRIDTFLVPTERVKRPKKGGLSILTQSGSFAVLIMDEMATEGIGIARIVSYGNKVDVDEADCLSFLSEDEATRYVLLYIESVENGREFVDMASRCTAKKPVIAIKVGKGEAGLHAARSHTGAMGGKYEIYRAAFKKAGIIEVDGYEGLKDACKVLDAYDMVHGKKVLIITDGGGIGVSMADACEELGLEVKRLTDDSRKSLSSRLPAFSATDNPIDLTASATDDSYFAAIEEGFLNGYDIAIVTVLWGPPTLTAGVVDRINEVMNSYNKPVIICSPGGEFTRKMGKLFEEKGMPVFLTPEAAVRAAAVLTGNGTRLN
ncbi:CoA-binding protein [Methanolobus mangrovi]|uniref:acetate--CoA ligase (ADP-forming) n=1 Tax=Methanolobus mangrovi TaxID=3072977 RepID=A0AA51YII2_9EURY|nr:CoA-binding protein [Methanolobus mangrovi]WMW21573.1 CoA-binding protein [Methanolobus mangrovi]